MSKIIDMKFNEEYIPLLEQGIKTCTTRRSLKGFTGDSFIVNGQKYEISSIICHRLWYALQYHDKEGFPSCRDFYEAIVKIYPDLNLDSEVYTYIFSKIQEV